MTQPPTQRMTVAIRDSREADLPAITAIYGHAVRTGTASFEYDPPDQAAWMATPATEGYPAFLITHQAAGFRGYGMGSYTFFTRACRSSRLTRSS